MTFPVNKSRTILLLISAIGGPDFVVNTCRGAAMDVLAMIPDPMYLHCFWGVYILNLRLLPWMTGGSDGF